MRTDEEWIRREVESVKRQMAEEREMYKKHYKERGNVPPGMLEDMEHY
jgi:phenylacetate-coenzyme A ligase PaaK-like adenylate-forming protein